MSLAECILSTSLEQTGGMLVPQVELLALEQQTCLLFEELRHA